MTKCDKTLQYVMKHGKNVTKRDNLINLQTALAMAFAIKCGLLNKLNNRKL